LSTHRKNVVPKTMIPPIDPKYSYQRRGKWRRRGSIWGGKGWGGEGEGKEREEGEGSRMGTGPGNWNGTFCPCSNDLKRK
jgi:hypothetical protein